MWNWFLDIELTELVTAVTNYARDLSSWAYPTKKKKKK